MPNLAVVVISWWLSPVFARFAVRTGGVIKVLFASIGPMIIGYMINDSLVEYFVKFRITSSIFSTRKVSKTTYETDLEQLLCRSRRINVARFGRELRRVVLTIYAEKQSTTEAAVAEVCPSLSN